MPILMTHLKAALFKCTLNKGIYITTYLPSLI